MNNNQKVRAGFSVLTNPPGRSPTGMKKITFNPEKAVKKVTPKKKTTKRKSSARKAR